ncbi:uncharacterized protein Z518_01069 [Rhinocladiella mackenziei CBS 650.93]|uniref:Uncharacterized protein n=1 Tax=Rhinocladiella mackenziei CBS 650.93 TaxID=1442369 RepID=A0A0D2HH81_9EURO|nr:uncharacterized protein Z518_01069 [Rhinocladiella mackenziei CBS 650.93]KIX09988.1 hypothetical protein Z518_01069 [Rhinocladiella mackenziei CBS 650.93]
MRSSLVGFVALTIVSATASLVYPETLPLGRRQAPGTPEYDCHSNCGAVIVAGRTEGYCETANFTTALDACLDCALEFDIWQYYGESVSAAAAGCGLDATPLPANSTSVTSSSSVSASTSVAETMTASASPEATTTASAPATSTDAATPTAEETESVVSDCLCNTQMISNVSNKDFTFQAPSSTSSGTPAAETFDGAGNRVLLSGGLAMVPLGAMVVGLV